MKETHFSDGMYKDSPGKSGQGTNSTKERAQDVSTNKYFTSYEGRSRQF